LSNSPDQESPQLDTPACDTIHGIFDAVAQRFPQAIALEEEAKAWSYAQVSDAAEWVAIQLSAHGVRPGDGVGLAMNRSAQQVIAMLGVLRSGAYYVPLSLDQPFHRLSLMADQAHVGLVLCDDLYGSSATDAFGVHTIVLDISARTLRSDFTNTQLAESLGGHRTTETSSPAAYVMFTSGSTGTPKGVVVTHQNVIGLVQGQSYVEFASTSTFLHLSNPSFDGATFEIWGALLAGGRAVIAPPGPPTLDGLERLLLARGVSTAFLTTALFHEIIDLRPQILSRLDWLLVGGEMMSTARARKGVELLGRRLLHVYGPTEGTTFSTYYPMAEMAADMPRVPIGRALARRRVAVVDEHMNECPAGVAGEIVVIGEGVALGYINSQPSDSDKFSISPFGEDCGAQMYRTGDIGRQLNDGTVDFLGRNDEQVKIRGYRIEPGEIEAVLNSYPTVRQSTVVVAERDNAAGLLVAFIVPRDGDVTDKTDIMAHMRARLPEYMIPTYLRVTDSLPLNTSGKVDKTALKQLATRSEPARDTSVDPTTAIDDGFANLWRAVLDLPADRELEEGDDFFALGGDSLLVLRLVSGAQESGFVLSVIDVFDMPSWGALSDLVRGRERSRKSKVGTDTPADDEPSLQADIERAYPATQMQLGMIYDAEAIGDGSLYHDGISVPVQAPLDERALNDTFQLIASRHEVLRTRFDLSGHDAALQLVERAPRVPVTVSDAAALSEDAQRVHVERRLQGIMLPFEVEEGPLLRAHAVRLSRTSFQLLFAFHHAIMDGWSESVLLSEFATAYPAMLNGAEPALPPKPAVPYQQLSILEGQALADPAVSGFWRNFVANVSPSRICPIAEGTDPTARRLTHRIELDPLLCGQLASAARSASSPLKSVLLAGHLAALSQELQSSQVVTGVVVNGRPELPGADRMVGLFLNVLPISVEVGSLGWRALIRAALETERRILPHRWYPYPQIYRDAGKELFDTAFNYVNFHLYAESTQADIVGFAEQRVLAKSSVALMVGVAQLPGTELLTLEFSVDPARLTQIQLQDFAARYSVMYKSLAMSLATTHNENCGRGPA
jgi:amino acid adenylation domain-containing protein